MHRSSLPKPCSGSPTDREVVRPPHGQIPSPAALGYSGTDGANVVQEPSNAPAALHREEQ
jgi:hypothetical protein